LVSDVEGFIPESTHVASTNNKLIRLRRISASLPPASWGVPSGGFSWSVYEGLLQGSFLVEQDHSP
ncbi:hypothetical protein KAT59_01835, partial [Candidatus Bipolaricaulota bacterium]|nr:hypothetical protein [Candidatus Bipolaricaulota bacterium]